MKTLIASAIVATTAFAGSAHALTEAQAAQIERAAPNVNVATLSDTEAAMVISMIHSGDNESDTRRSIDAYLN